MGEHSFESFYNGGGDFLDPNYASTGFKMSAGRIALPGMATTANQLGQAVEVLKSGVKAFEVTTLGLQGEDPIPRQHWDEMRALMKLSGVKPSLHGPLIDPAGFGERGWGGEIGRQDNERRMNDAMEKAHMLDPEGNVPIVFHASQGVGGREYRWEGEGENREKHLHKSNAINQETGEMIPIEYEEKFRPGRYDFDNEEFKETPFSVASQVGSANLAKWDTMMTDLATHNKHAEELMTPSIEKIRNIQEKEDGTLKDLQGNTISPEQYDRLDKEAVRQINKTDIFLENVDLNFKSAFHKAYKFGDEHTREELKEVAKEYSEYAGQIELGLEGQKDDTADRAELLIQKKGLIDNAVKGLRRATLQNGGPPELFQEVEDFSRDKSAETFSNIALKAYQDYGESAPIMAIENVPEHMAISDADSLRGVVETARESFIDKLMDKEGLSEREATEVAEKQIGATWDLGHINTLKKRGYTDEDVIEETKKMIDDPSLVKHLHLSDNFGYSDSDLAPGMGNVPFKEHLEQLEKTGKLDEMTKVIEAHSMITQFRTNPLGQTLKAFSSPIYGMTMGPTWNQVGNSAFGGYFSGMGDINPPNHHNLYGAGFTTLPTELGGQIAGTQSRFGGAPMA